MNLNQYSMNLAINGNKSKEIKSNVPEHFLIQISNSQDLDFFNENFQKSNELFQEVSIDNDTFYLCPAS